MLRQKQEKSGTGICHVMQGKESKTCPSDSPGISANNPKKEQYEQARKKEFVE